MAECRSCFAPIIWAVNDHTGSRMPVDSEPVEGGNVILTWGRPGEAPTATVLGRDAASVSAQPLYKSHYATCPHANQWRKAKARSHKDTRR